MQGQATQNALAYVSTRFWYILRLFSSHMSSIAK